MAWTSASILVLLVCVTSITYSELIIYPKIPHVGWSSKFTVFFRQGNGPRQRGNNYMIKSDTKYNQSLEGAPNRTVSWNSIAFSGEPVSVEIYLVTGDFTSCIVRPKSHNIKCIKTRAKNAQFNVTQNNLKLSVEFDYDTGGGDVDIENKLLIFADAPETNVPKHDPSVLYYGPGFHNLRSQKQISSNIKTVYIAPGSMVMGGFVTTGGSVKITGRGMLGGINYPPRYPLFSWGMINMDAGENHTIEGITIVDPTVFYIRAISKNLVVRDVKLIGAWTSGTDGIEAGENALIEDSFIMASDDAVKIYKSGMTVRRSVIWQGLFGAVFQFGWWPLHILKHVQISDIDIIHTDWCTFDGNTCKLGEADAVIDLAGPTQQLTISDMELRNIRIETPCPRIINFAMRSGSSGNVSDVRLIDWSIDSTKSLNSYPNKIAGSVPDARLSGWHFSNFMIGGKCVRSANDLSLVLDVTSDITFSCIANPVLVG